MSYNIANCLPQKANYCVFNANREEKHWEVAHNRSICAKVFEVSGSDKKLGKMRASPLCPLSWSSHLQLVLLTHSIISQILPIVASHHAGRKIKVGDKKHNRLCFKIEKLTFCLVRPFS